MGRERSTFDAFRRVEAARRLWLDAANTYHAPPLLILWKSPTDNVLHFPAQIFWFFSLKPIQLSESSSRTDKVARWPYKA